MPETGALFLLNFLFQLCKPCFKQNHFLSAGRTLFQMFFQVLGQTLFSREKLRELLPEILTSHE